MTSDSAVLTCTPPPLALTDISGVARRRCSAHHLLWLQTAGDRPCGCGCHGEEERVTTATCQSSAPHLNAAAPSASAIWEEHQWSDPRTPRSGRREESGARAGFQRGGLTKRLSPSIKMEKCRGSLHRRWRTRVNLR